ncbi:MAG: tol-pal system-associated acyl-CoA thioesterase [Wenzhouxiangella sp.]|nr:MAG: tol-pal system-associated acyl-CoA thioesterase [Wenzhouxiangella sp.]
MTGRGARTTGQATWRYRVYWEDTDAGGVVYHSRYLNFMERARSDWLLALGFPQVELRERQQRLFVVTSVRIDFCAPARLEDELAVDVAVEELRAASMRIGQRIVRQDGALLAKACITIACLAADSFRPARMPQSLRAAIVDFQGH